MQKYFAFIKKFFDFFRRHGDDDRSLMEKLRDKYRLVIMNDDTFEEVTSMKMTPLSLYIGVSSLIVGTAIIVTALIIWTPLKRYIPGYGDFTRDEEIAQLTSKVSDLEEEIEAHRRYNDNLRKILTGDLADMSKEAAQQQGLPPDSLNNIPPEDIERIPEDEQLRLAVEQGTFSRDPAAPPPTAAAGIGAFVPKDVPLEQLFFIPPVSGDATKNFDLQKNHLGIDVAAPKNTAVKAAADGVVISAGYTVETGYSIAIQHPNNVVTMYKHNSVLLKQAGTAVKAGEAIAIIGNTGENTSGPHLHFELWYKGRAVDPADYINFN
jgi:murein DD-endopeptidase MepM/ murein hydrolase activator NlpD